MGKLLIKSLTKLELRFGSRELAETAQVRFQQSSQKQGESLDDWADRVMTLATKAFRDLPEYYSNRQAVTKFCEGLLDKEASLAVLMKKPSDIETAMDSIRWYQHLHQSVYGRSKKKTNRDMMEESTHVAAVERTFEREPSKASASQSSSLEAAIQKLQESFDKMASKMVDKAESSASQSRPKPNEGKKKTIGPCFKCGKKGHFKQDCPSRQQKPKSDLNREGPRL